MMRPAVGADAVSRLFGRCDVCQIGGLMVVDMGCGVGHVADRNRALGALRTRDAHARERLLLRRTRAGPCLRDRFGEYSTVVQAVPKVCSVRAGKKRKRS